MPISRENRARYPSNWKAISEHIRFIRAGNRCECTGQCGEPHEDRCRALNGMPHPVTRSRVVLTVAHLNHTPEDNREENLLALCQRCHNRLDLEHRIRNRAETIAAKRDAESGQLGMFGRVRK